MNGSNIQIWDTIFWTAIVWMIFVSGLLGYDTYLMWFENTNIEFLRPQHGLKVTLLIVPALVVHYIAVSKRKIYRGSTNA